MRISIIAVGKIKEDWLKAGIAEYSKRISRFCEIEITEVPDAPEGDSIDKSLEQEGRKMLSKIKDSDFVVALDVNGEKQSSVTLSKSLIRWLDESGARVTFLIAGSNGYLPEVLVRANERISLSELTFPHQLTRLIFLEQIFRAFKISKGEKYHK
jgi:23S rRNA (pseudouridine1915-N3)-methyltransferase